MAEPVGSTSATEAAIPAEAIARMVDHVRRVCAKYAHVKEGHGNFNEDLLEVRAIHALLPPPIDPDLLEARRLAVEALVEKGGFGAEKLRDDLLTGKRDNDPAAVKAILNGIKRGRELAVSA